MPNWSAWTWYPSLVWDVLAMLPFKNIPEIDWAHAAACFCFLVEHTLSYLLENFGHVVGKLAVADLTAVKKTKLLLAIFRLAWSADKMGVPAAMELTFAKTKCRTGSMGATHLCNRVQVTWLRYCHM
ncbi:hypothetical protein DSO57_1028512 [Entomophthora muscae]|uniref:Uncharacterized protein n=1 Tax=Entomophthora muscae TaxID=34485 RepID=A0ACC2SEH0_9FUNG|nr:hypothetical protein DSO57_1028512 [Entomophthora muscae]